MTSWTQLTEQDGNGRVFETWIHTTARRRQVPIIVDALERRPSDTQSHPSSTTKLKFHTEPMLEFLSKVFLPAGYPGSVSPDYLRYQIMNALQAFCNSVSGLLSSRAVLEGYGVGNASASATNALLLTVLQDVFGRLTTIVAAYSIGTSLFPEAKTYRLLADIFNDAAVILDTLSPLMISTALPFHLPGLRVSMLCLSGSLRALCGIAAGGSKTAITLHLATPITGSGDVGDLNAKDSSKETVLALFGMLLGSVVVPMLTTPWATYTMLFALVGLHVFINYLGVKGLVLRSLNRQRSTILWSLFRETSSVPSPSVVSAHEKIFHFPGTLQNPVTGAVVGRCTIGSSLSSILDYPLSTEYIQIFQHEKYLLWFDRTCIARGSGQDTPNLVICRPLHVHIVLRVDHSHEDILRAWAHAVEVAIVAEAFRDQLPSENLVNAVATSLKEVQERFPEFLKGLKSNHWNISDIALLTGAPASLVKSIDTRNHESKKDQ